MQANTFYRSAEYQTRLEKLINDQKGSAAQQIRSRREIIQHAAAFQCMTEAIVKNDEPFTEDLIKECHLILTNGIQLYQGNNQRYQGMYRTEVVGAANTNFVVPKFIPKAMHDFLEELNTRLAQAEADKNLDPFFLAAFACEKFVNIHPFRDGNGRICRLILNAILMRYAGVVVPIGEHDQERREYMEMAMRASDEMTGPGELARLTLRKSREALKYLKKCLKK
jgi:Fic family protein